MNASNLCCQLDYWCKGAIIWTNMYITVLIQQRDLLFWIEHAIGGSFAYLHASQTWQVELQVQCSYFKCADFYYAWHISYWWHLCCHQFGHFISDLIYFSSHVIFKLVIEMLTCRTCSSLVKWCHLLTQMEHSLMGNTPSRCKPVSVSASRWHSWRRSTSESNDGIGWGFLCGCVCVCACVYLCMLTPPSCRHLPMLW